ncbi:hypothetical protein [Oceanospirillum sediminis]|uniref:Transposase IS4-like domain-containing protein n=1 Tax=Oceanospirillum sediminis TaxID=2760088 RepID=A0A839ISS8_9GAMM|nr:hypothetical protein [Oceanospirillum sediminis]MBB1487529.1 hypothetical protein [Oceanospirillum sediminis]
MSDKRFSRWYRRTFNFYEFNTRLIFGELKRSHQCIAAIDTSFMRKSGKHTEGLGRPISYYKARFQIEFVFRDAKQYTGLMDCQSRKKEVINTHLNASLSALNLLKLEDRRKKNTEEQTVISMVSWKRRKFNEHLMNRIFDRLGLSLKEKKVMYTYEQLSLYGVIAA